MANYNIALIILSYLVAVIGSLIALMVTHDALMRPAADRNRLVALAALCLGGVGIWSMHFIGMLAFEMNNMVMNFNWWLTALSLAVGVGVVYIGLALMSLGKFGYFKLIFAGVIVGLGVASMHYTGMLAMQVQAEMKWNWNIIAASIAIAVAAAIVALWLAVYVQRLWQMLISALIMGIAVCGMHYTGMAAVTFEHNPSLPFVEPMSFSTSIFSLIISAIDSIIAVWAMAVTMAEANRRKRPKN